MTVTDSAVTVVIPTRGNGRGLTRAIKSAIGQKDVEVRVIVLVDGQATDARDRQLLDSLASPHQALTVTRLGNPAPLRNLGLSLARTSVVAFLDDDDWWVPNKLQLQLETLRTSRCALVGSNALSVLSGVVQGLYHLDLPLRITLEDVMTTNWFITSSVIVEAAVLRAVGGFPVHESMRHCDDYAAWLKVATVAGVSVRPEPLVYYTQQSSGSVSSANALSGAETRRLVLNDLIYSTKCWGWHFTRRQQSLLKRLAGGNSG